MQLDNGMDGTTLTASTWRAWRYALGRPVPEHQAWEDAPDSEALPVMKLCQGIFRMALDPSGGWGELEGATAQDASRRIAREIDLVLTSPREELAWEAAVRHVFALCDAEDWGRNLQENEEGWEAWVRNRLNTQPQTV